MVAIFWNTGVSGNWSQKSNWSSGTVPGSTDDVTINATGTYTETVDSTYTVNSLTFNQSWREFLGNTRIARSYW